MRISAIAMIVMISASLIVDTGIWLYLRTVCRRHKRVPKIYEWSVLPVFALLTVAIALPRRNPDVSVLPNMWLLYSWLTIFFAKTAYLICALPGLIPLIWKRRPLDFADSVGIPVAITVFCTLWYGALIGRYEIGSTYTRLESPSLPSAFNGIKIVHISDIHTGTWGSDTTFISRMVDSVNAQHPDIIFFTGDIVNRCTSELEPFVRPLSRLKAHMGVYSVLGNHDLGDYTAWESPAQKADNLRRMEILQDSMGWKLLRNTHTYLRRDNDSIALIGVDNWGEPPYHQYGSLEQAYPKSKHNNAEYKILLTHNPRHWDMETSRTTNIDLTLSGHTHAMQFMLKAGDTRWSPAEFIYPQWGGLYSVPGGNRGNRYIYVNIGTGEVGMPYRIGATPEISVITLHRK